MTRREKEAISELANALQSLVGLSARLRHHVVGIVEDDVSQFEMTVDHAVGALKKLQPTRRGGAR